MRSDEKYKKNNKPYTLHVAKITENEILIIIGHSHLYVRIRLFCPVEKSWLLFIRYAVVYVFDHGKKHLL